MKSKTVKVVLALVLCPLVMWALSYMLPKRYTATMALLLDENVRLARPDSPTGFIDEMVQFGGSRSIATQLDQILGTEVMLNALQKTAEQHPDAFKDSAKAAERYANLINRVRVDNNKESQVVSLRVTMDDPQIAADTANNIGDAYMEFSRKLSAAKGGAALTLLDDSLNKNQKELGDIDKQIEGIKARYNIGDPTAAAQISDRNLKDLEMQIANMEAQYTGAVGELASAQQALAAVPKYLISGTRTDINPKAISIDNEIARVSSDLQALRAKYTDDYPQTRQMADKLADLQRERARTPDQINGGTQRSLNPNYTQFQTAVASAQAKASSYQQSLASLRSNYARVQTESRKYPEAEQLLAQLNRRKQNLELTYTQFMQKKASLEVSEGRGREAQAQIVSTALPSGTPSFPNPKVFVLMGLAVGIIISALIVMPKAPDILYAPTATDTLALDPSMRTTAAALPAQEPVVAGRPALEEGRAE